MRAAAALKSMRAAAALKSMRAAAALKSMLAAAALKSMRAAAAQLWLSSFGGYSLDSSRTRKLPMWFSSRNIQTFGIFKHLK